MMLPLASYGRFVIVVGVLGLAMFIVVFRPVMVAKLSALNALHHGSSLPEAAAETFAERLAVGVRCGFCGDEGTPFCLDRAGVTVLLRFTRSRRERLRAAGRSAGNALVTVTSGDRSCSDQAGPLQDRLEPGPVTFRIEARVDAQRQDVERAVLAGLVEPA